MNPTRAMVLTIVAATVAAVVTEPAQADVVLEGIQAARCSEGPAVQLPRKMSFYQAVTSDEFEGFGSVSLVLWSAMSGRPDLDGGKVIATARQIKPDGSVIWLGKVSRSFRAGVAERERAVSTTLEEGDLIEWQLKLKQLPRLEAFLECWLVELGIAAAEALQ